MPAQDPFKLIEQIVLLLGQASNSILYSRRLQILKTLIKDPKKAKNILKEKADLLQKGDQNLFGKKFRSHIVETECSKKRTLEVFCVVEVVVLLFLLPKSPFGQALHQTTINSKAEGNFTTVKNQTIETDIAYNTVENKTNGTVVSRVSKVLHQNLAPLSRNFPELIPEESLTNVHPLVKDLFTGKIPNLEWTGRLAYFSKN